MMLSLPNLFIPKYKHFGLAIGRTSLRALELGDTGKIRMMVEMVFPEEVFQAGILVKPDVFINSLKKLITVGKFTTQYVSVSFSEVYAYSREYSLPIISVEEVYEAVNWHVKDLFPFPQDELYFDWKILEKSSTEYKIAVVAVQKKVLDPLVDAIKQVGLKPLSFEPGASAIARLLLLKPGEHTIVTEINKKGSYVTLVEGEKAIFTTIINYAVNDNTDTYLSNICQTITDIFRFYEQKNILKSGELVPIVLTGELANQDLSVKIKNCSKLNCKLLLTRTNNPAFNKAYAVAVEKIAPPMDPDSINLLPINVQAFYDQERKDLFMKSLFNRVAIFMAIIFLLAISAFLAVTNQRINLDKRVKFLTTATDVEDGKSQNLLLLNAQAKNIVELALLRETPKNYLVTIGNLLNDKISISSWDYDDAKLIFTLSGVALTREELLNFKTRLEESGVFSKVTLPLGSLETPENVRFTISFIVQK